MQISVRSFRPEYEEPALNLRVWFQLASEPAFGYDIQKLSCFTFSSCSCLARLFCHKLFKHLFCHSTFVGDDIAVLVDYDVTWNCVHAVFGESSAAPVSTLCIRFIQPDRILYLVAVYVLVYRRFFRSGTARSKQFVFVFEPSGDIFNVLGNILRLLCGGMNRDKDAAPALEPL